MTDKNKPAFPQCVPHPDDFAHGMTLRDYFAAKAMPAVYEWFEGAQLADHEDSLDLDVDEVDGTPSSDAMLVAKWSYGLADAMMKARDDPTSNAMLKARGAIADDAKVEGLGLAAKTENLLIEEGINTIEQLTKRRRNDLLKIPNMGRKSLAQIQQVLALRGLRLIDGD
jgi:hypothetical protein